MWLILRKDHMNIRTAAMNANIQIEELNKLTSSVRWYLLNMDMDQVYHLEKNINALINLLIII